MEVWALLMYLFDWASTGFRDTLIWLRPSPSLPAVRGRAAAAIQGWRKNVLSISALVCSSTMAVDLAMNKYGGGGGGVVVRLKTNKKKVVNKGSEK